MPGETKSHYETLGIRQDASPDAIRRAYFKSVRAHSPENDPAGFQRVSEAYRVLSDPEARKAYDAAEPIPATLAQALAAAAELVSTDPKRAAEYAGRVVAARGTPAIAIRFAATLCLEAGLAPLAHRLTSRLLQEFPPTDDAALLHGQVLAACGRWRDAIATLRPLVARRPELMIATKLLAESLRQNRKAEDALQVLGRFAERAGTASLELLQIHLARFVIAAEADLLPEAEEALRAVGECTPADDDDARWYVATAWAGIAVEFEARRALRVARIAADASLAVIDTPAARTIRARIDDGVRIDAELTAALRDDAVAPWVRAVIADAGGRTTTVDWHEASAPLLERACEDLQAADEDWDVLRARHPRVAAAAAESWAAYRAQGAARNEERERAAAAKRKETRNSLLFLAGALALITGCAIIADQFREVPSLFRSRPSGSAPRETSPPGARAAASPEAAAARRTLYPRLARGDAPRLTESERASFSGTDAATLIEELADLPAEERGRVAARLSAEGLAPQDPAWTKAFPR